MMKPHRPSPLSTVAGTGWRTYDASPPRTLKRCSPSGYRSWIPVLALGSLLTLVITVISHPKWSDAQSRVIDRVAREIDDPRAPLDEGCKDFLLDSPLGPRGGPRGISPLSEAELPVHEPDAQSQAQTPTSLPRRIYFLDVSSSSSPSSMCAIESALLLNPSYEILIFTPNPAALQDALTSTLDGQSSLLSRVRARALDWGAAFRGTPFEGWYASLSNSSSHHTLPLGDAHEDEVAEAFRLAVLWKDGGTFLDLTFISTNPLPRPRTAQRILGMYGHDRTGLGLHGEEDSEGPDAMASSAMMVFPRHDPLVWLAMQELTKNTAVQEEQQHRNPAFASPLLTRLLAAYCPTLRAQRALRMGTLFPGLYPEPATRPDPSCADSSSSSSNLDSIPDSDTNWDDDDARTPCAPLPIPADTPGICTSLALLDAARLFPVPFAERAGLDSAWRGGGGGVADVWGPEWQCDVLGVARGQSVGVVLWGPGPAGAHAHPEADVGFAEADWGWERERERGDRGGGGGGIEGGMTLRRKILERACPFSTEASF